MQTNDLIDTLSADVRPGWFTSAAVIISSAAVLSYAVVITIALVWLGIRTDLLQTVLAGDFAFFLRLTFIISIMILALICLRDLAVPGRRMRLPPIVTLLPLLLMGVLGLLDLAIAPFEEWSLQVVREPWISCLSQIAVLALPAFVITTLALRMLAPTDLRWAGLYVGLFSGGIGALAYVLCSDGHTIIFSATAYTSAISAFAALGLLLGPHLLRWS
ncbi:NrsF family protein [Pseudorhodoplanes sinuspersici]|nr:DUF1109 domain-containing protein [Pseudorhodoplanes sinuspersici]RKE68182.1 hypothetical protein DFP91_4549 [Pseudorhodoplanes sinuspersici]